MRREERKTSRGKENETVEVQGEHETVKVFEGAHNFSTFKKRRKEDLKKQKLKKN